MFLCCHSSRTLISTVEKEIVTPQYLEVSGLAPATNVNWYLNGEEVAPDQSGKILFTRSGQYTLKGKYYSQGQVDSVLVKLKVKPPDSNCNIAINTKFGTMVAQLSGRTPRHTDHFVEMVESGYYDSLTFHRVIPGFVIQGGDGNTRNGSADGLKIPLSDLSPEFDPEMLHYRGAVAMARMPDETNPEKISSPDQFYIVHGGSLDEDRLEEISAEKGIVYRSYQRERYLEEGGAPQLDMEYTVFGYLTHGLHVLDSIAVVNTAEGNQPTDTVYMKLHVIK